VQVLWERWANKKNQKLKDEKNSGHWLFQFQSLTEKCFKSGVLRVKVRELLLTRGDGEKDTAQLLEPWDSF